MPMNGGIFLNPVIRETSSSSFGLTAQLNDITGCAGVLAKNRHIQ